MPRTLSDDVKDFIIKVPYIYLFILKLLNRDPMKRLGAKRDAEEIREHPWLKTINWNDCIERFSYSHIYGCRKLRVPRPEKKNFSKVPMEMNLDEVDTRNRID
jgi:hypothetical protein